jgi:membrane protein implicated in regulation of membrane protease activity
MQIFKETVEMFSQTVEGTIEQCGENQIKVRALGSIWRAILPAQCGETSLVPGQFVQVLGRKGIRLIVSP